MKKIKILVLSLLLFVVIPVVAQEKIANAIPISTQDQILNQKVFTQQPGSILWLDGTSTLHDYKSISNKIISEFITNSDNFVDFITNKDGAKFNLKTIIPVISLKHNKFNEDLDDNLYDAMNEEEYKDIVYELTSYKSTVLPDSGKNWYLLNTIGNLTIASVKKTIEMKAIVYNTSDGTIHFKGSKLINMEDYNIEPPSMMFGMLKTDKFVTISFNLIFK